MASTAVEASVATGGAGEGEGGFILFTAPGGSEFSISRAVWLRIGVVHRMLTGVHRLSQRRRRATRLGDTRGDGLRECLARRIRVGSPSRNPGYC